MVAQHDDKGGFIPKIKLSNNVGKVTTPGVKKVVRIYDKYTYKLKADVIALEDEYFNEKQDWTIRDPHARWKKKVLKGGEYVTRELLIPIFRDGKCIYKTPTTEQIRQYAKSELDTLWDEFKRLLNPEVLPVDLSDDLYLLKERMLDEYRKV